MKTVSILSASLLSVIVGGMVGGYAVYHLMGKSVKNIAYTSDISTSTREVDESIEALRLLKAGNAADAVKTLERRLDTAVSNLGLYEASEFDADVHLAVTESLNEVRAYRAQYPWTSATPDIQREVERVLASAGQEQKK